MRTFLLLVMIIGCGAVHAEVFKCTDKSGKTVYQEKPCQAAAKEQLLDIKADPVKEAEAKAKLEALRMENDARRAERLQVEEEAAAARYQTQQVDALNRSAFAQQQQAAAQQRQAEALERQNQVITTPWWGFSPGHPTFRRSPGVGDDRHFNPDRGMNRDVRQRRQSDDKPAPISPFPRSPSSSLRPGRP